MTTSRDYAKALEKKLIEQFKQTFHEKMGYYPMVITRVNKDHDGYIPVMSLEALSGYFDKYLPSKFGKILKLQTKARHREIVNLRMIYCTLAKSMHHTAKSIGEFLGGRDHTTVLHNMGQCKNLMEYNEDFKELYLTILNEIKQDYSYESPALDHFTQVPVISEPGIRA